MNKDTVQLFDQKGGFEAKAILFTDGFFCRTEADVRFLRSTILFNDLLGVTQLQLGGPEGTDGYGSTGCQRG